MGCGLTPAVEDSLHPLFSVTYHARMGLTRAERELRQSVKENSALEGIHHPFAKGRRMYWPRTMDDLVRYWKKRVARDRLLRRKKASRAARSRGSSPCG